MEVGAARVDLSACLLGCTDRIVDDYVARLRASGSPIAERAQVLAGARAQARSLVVELSERLADQPPARVRHPDRGLSRRIGAERARSRVHPRVSLMAGADLFGAVIDTVAGQLADRAGAARTIAEVSVVVNRLLAERIGAGADAYASYLLAEVRRANVTERERIARGLHDRVGHDVHLAYRQLELAAIARASDRPRADAAVDDAAESVRHTIESVREVITGLRVGEPVENLEKALRVVAESDLAAGVDVEISVNGDESWAPLEILDEMYLVTREALRNALSHASASHVEVLIDVAPHELRAVVRDDGTGFDPTLPRAVESTGLMSLRERVAMLNGVVLLVSEPGQGTIVDILTPLPGLHRDGTA